MCSFIFEKNVFFIYVCLKIDFLKDHTHKISNRNFLQSCKFGGKSAYKYSSKSANKPGPGGTWSRGVYLVLGCTWSWGVYLVLGVYLVSGRMYLVPGVCTWSCWLHLVWGYLVPVVYLVLGGVPGPWGCTCPSTPPCEQNSWHTLLKILPCPKLHLQAVNITFFLGRLKIFFKKIIDAYTKIWIELLIWLFWGRNYWGSCRVQRIQLANLLARLTQFFHKIYVLLSRRLTTIGVFLGSLSRIFEFLLICL